MVHSKQHFNSRAVIKLMLDLLFTSSFMIKLYDQVMQFNVIHLIKELAIRYLVITILKFKW